MKTEDKTLSDYLLRETRKFPGLFESPISQKTRKKIDNEIKELYESDKKLYRQSDTLQKFIDWENIMKMGRYAGGHDCQMQGLFKDAVVLGHWNEDVWQGQVATAVQLNDMYIIYNDYYGSCSGCDSWEGADDNEVINMCIGLANSAYIFDSIGDMLIFLKLPVEEWSSWDTECKQGLLQEIVGNINWKENENTGN